MGFLESSFGLDLLDVSNSSFHHTQSYLLLWGCWVCSRTTLCHCILFHLVGGSFMIIGVCTVGYDGYYYQGDHFRVGFYFMALFSYQYYSGLLGKTKRVMPCLFLGYLLACEEPLLLCS
jgi:hypothetical protein